MNTRYYDQSEGATPSKSVGRWFLYLSVAIPWSGIYLVVLWLWN